MLYSIFSNDWLSSYDPGAVSLFKIWISCPPFGNAQDLILTRAGSQMSLRIQDGRVTDHGSLSITSLVNLYFNHGQWNWTEKERGATISTTLRVLTLHSSLDNLSKVS